MMINKVYCLDKIGFSIYFVLCWINKRNNNQQRERNKKMNGTHISVKTASNGDRLFYSLVEMESKSGFAWNKRILVLVEDKYLGYIKQFNPKDIDGSFDIKKIERKVPLKELRKITPKQKILTILINIYQDGKRKSSKWIFRMPSPKIAEEWTEVLDKQNSPFPSRTPTQHKKNQTQNSPLQQKNPTMKQLKNQQQKAKDALPTSGLSPEKDNLNRLSNKPFSFQADNETEQNQSQIFSPDKEKEQSSKVFSPVKRERVFVEEQSLSEKLQKQVNLNIVQWELSSFKQNKLNKKGIKETQFKQLSSMIGKKKDIYSLNFFDYFRVPAPLVDDEKYRDFYELCRQLAEDLSLFRQQFSDHTFTQQIRINNGVIVKFIESDLKQIPGDNQVCDEGLLKSYLNQFKNLNYLWRNISEDQVLRKVFLIPMNCIIEHQGILFYFTCDFNKRKNFANDIDVDYSQYFERLSQISMVNKLALESQESVKFYPYSQNQFVISEVNLYLPKLIPSSTQLRPQFFKNLVEEGKITEAYLVKKGKKEEDQQNRIFSQALKNAMTIFSNNLNKLQEYLIHPREFSTLMHMYGLNINMINNVYELIENTFMREIMKTEVAMRAFKMIYRKKMQESVVEKASTQQKNKLNARLTKGIINVLFGNTKQSDTMWKIVTLHTQVYFKLPVNKTQVNKGYLLLGLQHHLGIKIQTEFPSSKHIFETQNFVNSVLFEFKIKMCELFWADEIQQLETMEAAEVLITNFDLKNKNFPFYVYQDYQLHQTLLDIISLYYGPHSNLSKLAIYRKYQTSEDLTLQYHRRKITELKWLIKERRTTIQEVQQKMLDLQQPLKFYFGNNHPFFTEVCDMLIALYEQNGSFDKAYDCCKVSLANTIQLCGGNNMHIKLAANFYQMGETLQMWRKLDQSIVQYKKAKNILQFNSYTNGREYALILLRLANLYLVKFKDQQCFKLVLNSLQILFQKEPENSLQEIINGFQLLNRCDPEIPLRTETLLKNIIYLFNETLSKDIIADEQMIMLIKITLECYFIQKNRQIDSNFIDFIALVSDQIGMSSHQAQRDQGLQIIKQFMAADIFFKTLQDFSSKAKVCLQIKNKKRENASVQNRVVDNFEKLITCIIVVIGEGFMLGLVENLQK